MNDRSRERFAELVRLWEELDEEGRAIMYGLILSLVVKFRGETGLLATDLTN